MYNFYITPASYFWDQRPCPTWSLLYEFARASLTKHDKPWLMPQTLSVPRSWRPRSRRGQGGSS